MANLIANPSFEANTNGWDLDATDYVRTNTDAHDGTWSVKQTSTSAFANFCTKNDATGIDILTNTEYILTFWLKLTSSNPTHIQLNHGGAFGTSYLDNALVDTGGNWQQITKKFNSGAFGKVWIRFYNNGGTVTAFFDEFFMDVVPKSFKGLLGVGI